MAKKVYQRPTKRKYGKMKADKYPPKYEKYERPRKRKKGTK